MSFTVESDNEKVISKLRNSASLSNLDEVIGDCNQLKNDFLAIDFSHVRREVNKVAHGLAPWPK